MGWWTGNGGLESVDWAGGWGQWPGAGGRGRWTGVGGLGWCTGLGPVFLSPRDLVMDFVQKSMGLKGVQVERNVLPRGLQKARSDFLLWLGGGQAARSGLMESPWGRGHRWPRGQGFDTLCRAGAQWIGVPGELRGYAEAHRRHGRLPWEQLFTPTIALLRGGFRVPNILASFLHSPFLRPSLTESSLR